MGGGWEVREGWGVGEGEGGWGSEWVREKGRGGE